MDEYLSDLKQKLQQSAESTKTYTQKVREGMANIALSYSYEQDPTFIKEKGQSLP